MSNIEGEKSAVLSTLRACLISAQDGIPVSYLNRDYQQLVGENIPYQRLGFKSLEDFLRSLPDISVVSRGGQYYVEARANDKTASLISLVKGQKRSAPRKRSKACRNVVHIRQSRPPRYRRRPTAPAAPRWPAMKVQVPQNTSNGPSRIVSCKPDRNAISCDENKNVRVNSTKPQSKPPAQLPRQPLLTPSQPSQRPALLPTPTVVHSTPVIPPPPSNRLTQFYDASRKIGSKNTTSDNSSTIPYKHSVSIDSASPAPPSNMLNSRLQKNKSSPDFQKPSQEIDSKLSHRLKKASQPNSIKVSNPVPIVPRQPAQSRLEKVRIALPETKLVVVVDKQEGNKDCFYQSQLSDYTQEQNYSEPSYVVYKQSGKRGSKVCYACTVRVAIPRQSKSLPMEMFECSTFPVDYLNPGEAKEHAAKSALEQLKEREGLVNVPIEQDPLIIVERIKKFAQNKESGIWAQKVEDEYKFNHEQLLPDYWLDIVKVSDQFEVEACGPSFIIWLKGKQTVVSPAKIRKMSELIYPSGTTWDVFITAGTSVSNVHLRFIGDEYSTRFDVFSAAMESYYENQSNRMQPDLSVGEYCIAYYSKGWWRVIITNLDGDYIRIKFIDHGDEDVISRSNLYKLDSQFFNLPPQAVSISLRGLEEYAKRREASDFLNKTIIGKSLVGKIESFKKNCISLTLYDTSEEEAINLNESLRRLFELDYKELPNLEVGSVHELTVTNVELDGTVFIQMETDGLTLLEEFIEFYEEIDFESLTDYKQICKDKVYLAVHQEDNVYYRVKPLTTTPSVDSKVQVYCIDYGKCISVFLEDIIHMEDSSYLLEEIPGQAMPVILHDIPGSVFSPSIRDKLCSLVLGDPSPVIVGKVNGLRNGVPVLELFKRTAPDNLLASINATLVFEERINLSDQFDDLHISNSPVKKSTRHSTSLMQPGNKTKITTQLMTKILAAYPLGAIERILSQNRPELPEIDGYFDIYVHSTASPSHFLINPSEFVDSLNNVMDEMNSYYNANKVQTILEEGSLCAARDGNYWYRAYTDKIIDHDNVSVKVVDYGCVKIISSTNIKPLLDVFTKHPYIGFSAKLHGIAPIHGDWSVEDSITMKNLINKKTIRAKLKDILPNKQGLGGMTLSLELFATDNSGQEYNVAEHFVKQFNAKFE